MDRSSNRLKQIKSYGVKYNGVLFSAPGLRSDPDIARSGANNGARRPARRRIAAPIAAGLNPRSRGTTLATSAGSHANAADTSPGCSKPPARARTGHCRHPVHRAWRIRDDDGVHARQRHAPAACAVSGCGAARSHLARRTGRERARLAVDSRDWRLRADAFVRRLRRNRARPDGAQARVREQNACVAKRCRAATSTCWESGRRSAGFWPRRITSRTRLGHRSEPRHLGAALRQRTRRSLAASSAPSAPSTPSSA